MKRCPQCEFIYEDDQSLCDMDGVLLVFDVTNICPISMRSRPYRGPAKDSSEAKPRRSGLCDRDSRAGPRNGLLRLHARE